MGKHVKNHGLSDTTPTNEGKMHSIPDKFTLN